jgi:hypothetical protein
MHLIIDASLQESGASKIPGPSGYKRDVDGSAKDSYLCRRTYC